MPLDTTYTTICSLLPFDLIESKPGLHPNEYIIKKAPSINGFALTIIPNNVFYLINPDPLSDAKEVRNIKVPVPSIEIANSLINDYCNALLGVEVPDSMPGLFAAPGNYTDIKDFGLANMLQLKTSRDGQNRWFKNLVDMADDTWSRNKSPFGISDLERDAARSLGLEREWLYSVITPETLNKCPFCQNIINVGAIKCITCGEILDRKKYQELTGAAK